MLIQPILTLLIAIRKIKSLIILTLDMVLRCYRWCEKTTFV